MLKKTLLTKKVMLLLEPWGIDSDILVLLRQELFLTY